LNAGSVSLPRAPAAWAGEVQFQVVAFGIEHVNGIAAVAFHDAMKFAGAL
jgi:hypothetical protein